MELETIYLRIYVSYKQTQKFAKAKKPPRKIKKVVNALLLRNN